MTQEISGDRGSGSSGNPASSSSIIGLFSGYKRSNSRYFSNVKNGRYKGKGLDLGEEPPRVKLFSVPLGFHSSPGEKLACVASVSSRGSSRKPGQEQKKPFFCFCSNFRAITRLETLATQASEKPRPVSFKPTPCVNGFCLHGSHCLGIQTG